MCNQIPTENLKLLDLQLNHPYFAKSLAIKPDDRPEDDKKILQLIRRAAKDVVDDADAVFTTLPKVVMADDPTRIPPPKSRPVNSFAKILPCSLTERFQLNGRPVLVLDQQLRLASGGFDLALEQYIATKASWIDQTLTPRSFLLRPSLSNGCAEFPGRFVLLPADGYTQ
ncbi:hypothetical protein BDZ45DRAFT_751376 [Acephala macrosclerotiorum]|nr:hypothetical protein BDZ45DRAFT_751376 [Acephala macrosclerotiorum]